MTPLPKMIEHGEPGGVSCTPRQSVTGGEIGVQPPPQAPVEALGAIDVGHRNDDDLEFRVDRPGARDLGCLFVAHCVLLMCKAWTSSSRHATPRHARMRTSGRLLKTKTSGQF